MSSPAAADVAILLHVPAVEVALLCAPYPTTLPGYLPDPPEEELSEETKGQCCHRVFLSRLPVRAELVEGKIRRRIKLRERGFKLFFSLPGNRLVDIGSRAAPTAPDAQ